MTVPGLSISIVFIVFCCVAAHLARGVIAVYSREGLVEILLKEFIATAELCACCFELIIVADNYGVATYTICLFFLTIWWSKVWEDAAACPYIHMQSFIQGETSLSGVALKIFAELMGGYCVYRFIQVFWWFELTAAHEARAFENCSADLQVNQYIGAVIEGIGTLSYLLVSKAIAQVEPKHSAIFDSFVSTSLVVLAFNYSGGYFNPVLATALKWGCSGHTKLEHITVYWIGASIGALLVLPLHKISGIGHCLSAKQENKND